MAENDATNSGLQGTTGSGQYVGDSTPTIDAATLTGAIDAGGATSLEIPNSADPSLDAAGEVALDTTIADYTPLLAYYSGTEKMYVVGMPQTNLSTSDGFVVAYNATNDEFEMVEAGGGGGNREIMFDMTDLQSVETNFAPLTQLNGTTVKVMIRSFDDTTEEYANGKFQVPAEIDTSGTVTFRTYVMAATAAASKNVALTFGHVALNNSEDFDVAYTDEDSGDKAIDATQDDLTEITWTETVSNLGWAANDLVLFRVSRPAASVDNLTGDMYMFSFTIEIPRA